MLSLATAGGHQVELYGPMQGGREISVPMFPSIRDGSPRRPSLWGRRAVEADAQPLNTAPPTVERALRPSPPAATPSRDTDVLCTSSRDGPGSLRGFYLRYGFADTGRVMWGENVLAFTVAAGASARTSQ